MTRSEAKKTQGYAVIRNMGDIAAIIAQEADQEVLRKVAAEREACARIARKMGAAAIEKAIRARGEVQK